MSKPKPKVTVVTVTLNAAKDLRRLADSLVGESARGAQFIWLVKDGGSEDKTLQILEEYKLKLEIQVIQRSDSGIYSALNQALHVIGTEFYIVAGADDYFLPGGLIDLVNASYDMDMVCGKVQTVPQIKFEYLRFWRHGIAAILGCHSVGCLIRTDLHRKFGQYSETFSLVSDQKFLIAAYKSGVRLKYLGRKVGYYSLGGISSRNSLIMAKEFRKMMVDFGEDSIRQWLLYFFRRLKLLFKKS